MSSIRSKLRTIFVQTLFELDFHNNLNIKSKDLLKETFERQITESKIEGGDDNYKKFLLADFLSKKEEIDLLITTVAPDWTLEKMIIVDRNILRLGAYELLFGAKINVPVKVAINEAIETAKDLSGNTNASFINGILGSIFKNMDEYKENDSDSTVHRKKVKKYTGALVYRITEENEICFALVRDLFGKWTLSKGEMEKKESPSDSVKRVIKEELGLSVVFDSEIGNNSYISHPPEGPLRKEIRYFLVKTEDKEIILKKSKGLKDAQWFNLDDLSNLMLYRDIKEIILNTAKQVANKIK